MKFIVGYNEEGEKLVIPLDRVDRIKFAAPGAKGEDAGVAIRANNLQALYHLRSFVVTDKI